MNEPLMSGVPHVAFVGDSLITGIGDASGLGWCTRLVMLSARGQKAFIPYVLGVPGDTSSMIREHFAVEVDRRLAHQEDARVVFQFGVEDCRLLGEKPQVGLRESVLNLKSMMTAAKGRYRMLVVSPPPVYDPAINARLQRLVHAQSELARSMQVPFIDVFKPLNSDVQYKRELSQFDKVHPQQRGYEKIFSIISNDRQWWFSR